MLRQDSNFGPGMAHPALASESIGSIYMAIKIIVERHADGYLAYPIGLKGVVLGEGDTYEDALADVKSAIRFHVQTFGTKVLEDNAEVMNAFVAEADVPA
jgi:predicted RNase H-like HicB family nuclease